MPLDCVRPLGLGKGIGARTRWLGSIHMEAIWEILAMYSNSYHTLGGRLTILILNGSVALGILIRPSSDANDNLIGIQKSSL